MNEPVAATAPKVGFVSLGCPKALTDSELILTQLSAEGYTTSKSYAGADLVIVNTCGFIDDAVKESLDAIENGTFGTEASSGDVAADTAAGLIVGSSDVLADGVVGGWSTRGMSTLWRPTA